MLLTLLYTSYNLPHWPVRTTIRNDNLADVIATTESLKAVAGISVCIPIISALAGIGGSLGSQWFSHHFITTRERRTSEDKLAREHYFIATKLIFMLEQYAEGGPGLQRITAEIIKTDCLNEKLRPVALS